MKIFVKKDDSDSQQEDAHRTPTVGFKIDRRSNATHHSMTAPDVRQYMKSEVTNFA